MVCDHDSLLNLSAPVAELVESGTLSAGHARALLSVEDPVLQAKAAEQVIARSFSVRRTEQLAARIRKEASALPKEETSSDTVDYAAVLSEELSLQLGRRVQLIDRKGRGRLELYFDSADDRERLIALLRSLA